MAEDIITADKLLARAEVNGYRMEASSKKQGSESR